MNLLFLSFLSRTLLLNAVLNLIQTDAKQIPFQNNFTISTSTKEPIPWNFFEKPSRNSTGHLIFDTVNSFLQHWPNTRYRNGHSIVPGTIPTGTLLHHGTSREEIPRSPEWTAIDPEHSYFYCFSTPEDSGCWHLTLVATRPLRVLYFDGSSAAKFRGGSMDSQDILIWGELKEEWLFKENKRLGDLCEWGKRYGIDGFVRMEMDFEVMLCDFTAGVEVVSFQHLVPREMDRKGRLGWRKDMNASRNLTIPINLPTTFRAIEAGTRHNYFPGETRIQLNYAGVVSFYDTTLFPSLKHLRSKQERWDHRLEGISSEDIQTLLKTLGSILDTAWDRPTSVIDWKTFLRVVVDRYIGRLQILSHLLNSTVLDSEADAMLAVKKAHSHMSGMLSPYRIYSVSPPPEARSIPKLSWAIPVFEECATIHTRYIDSNPSLSQKLSYSEHLLLDSTKLVCKEICRTIVGMWAEGMEGLTISAQEMATRWKGLTEELIAWLDWSEWVSCRPACGNEVSRCILVGMMDAEWVVQEICYLPTWPFFMDDSIKPEPRCLGRIA